MNKNLIRHFVRMYNSIMLHGVSDLRYYEHFINRQHIGKWQWRGLYLNFWILFPLYKHCLQTLLVTDYKTCENLDKFTDLKINRNRFELIIVNGFEYIFLLLCDRRYDDKHKACNKSHHLAGFLNKFLKYPMSYQSYGRFCKKFPTADKYGAEYMLKIWYI